MYPSRFRKTKSIAQPNVKINNITVISLLLYARILNNMLSTNSTLIVLSVKINNNSGCITNRSRLHL